MAEGILKSFKPDFQIFSAGIKPEKEISPYAVQVLHEIGVDISKSHPKSTDLYKKQKFDYVITLSESAEKECRNFRASNKYHFEINDPFNLVGTKDEILKVYRDARNEISALLKKLFLNYHL